MALPFDLRAYASDDTDDHSHHASSRASWRPSRAIAIPATLPARIRAHDVDALRELVQLTYIPLVRFAQSIVRSYDEAEDVVQDVFTILWDRAAQWNPETNVAAYLFASVRNQALKEIRRQGRAQRRAERAQADWHSDANSPTNGITDNALDRVVDAETDAARANAIWTVLESCTERQRTAYDLRYHRGLTIPAIAEVLGITVKGAEQLVRRVTHLVLARLKDQ